MRTIEISVASLAFVLSLSACGTVDVTALEDASKSLAQASSVAAEADRDLLRAYSLGMNKSAASKLEETVCGGQVIEATADAPKHVQGSGASAVQSYLSVYPDSLDSIQKVGKTPTDTSYTGYVKKMRDNQKAIDGMPEEKKQAEKEKARLARLDALNRCLDLYRADSSAGSRLTAPPDMKALGLLPAVPIIPLFLALNKFAKTIVATAEKAQREEAIKETVKQILPQLDEAAKAMNVTAGAEFGSKVEYPVGVKGAAVDMNQTVLGATITIRRWFLAQQINEQEAYLADCQAKVAHCLGSPTVQAAMNAFAVNVQAYRALTQVDTIKIQKALKDTVAATQKAVDDANTKPLDLLDSLVTIADSLSDMASAHDAYEKAKAGKS